MPTPRNLLQVPSEISLQSLPMAIVDLLLCSTRECSMFQIQCHGFSGDVQVMSCTCFTGKSINYHAASLSFHDAIPNSHTPSLPGIGKACVVLFACDVGREDGEKAMLPVKDVDLSSVNSTFDWLCV